MIKENILKIFKDKCIEYKMYEHEPVLDYEKALEIREKFKLEGVESKSLFLSTKSGNYFIFVTEETKKMNSTLIKKILGEKVSVASSQELKDITGCEPGCAAPFGYQDDISLIIDKGIYNHAKFVFSPGIPEITIEIYTKDIPQILELLDNKIYYYEDK